MTQTPGSYPKIPEQLIYKIRDMPECSYGAIRVTLILRNGQAVFDVFVSDGLGEIAKVGTKLIESPEDLNFRPEDIVDVLRG